MHKESNYLTQSHPTKQCRDNFIQMKLQLISQKDQPSSQLLFKELNSNAKNQTLNQESSAQEQEDDSNSSEVSFQDDILESHETALNLEIEKNEALFMIQNCRQKTKQIVFKIGSFYDTLYKVLMPNTSCALIQAFHCYLEQHNNFKQLLSHIHCSYQDKISNKLLQLSFMVWSIYRSFLSKSLSKPEIFNIAHAFSQKLSSHQSILKRSKTQPLSFQQSQMRSNFIQFFTTTVILVLEGFFKNPLGSPAHMGGRRFVRSLDETRQVNHLARELGQESRKMVKTDHL